MFLAEGYVSEFGVAEFGAGCLKPSVCLLGPEGATVLEHELVDRETSVFAAQEPDCQWLVTGRFPDRLPDVALVESDFPALGEVEVFSPSVAVVTDEFYNTSDTIGASLVFAAVEYVLPSNVSQDD